MGEPQCFAYDYETLMRLTGLAKNTLYQHKRRGSFDPEDLGSIAIFLARHGTLDLRQKMMVNALVREAPPVVKNPKRRQAR